MIKRMKKVIVFALTTMILTTAVAATASAATVKTSSRVVLRQKASVSSKKLSVVSKGVRRTVLGSSSSGKWVKIKYNGKIGYIHNNHISKKSMGKFKLTYYGGDTMTASGKTPQINHTIAVDPRLIKLGSYVYVKQFGNYYAEDTGGAIKGNILDVFVRTEREANRIGIDYANVYVYQ